MTDPARRRQWPARLAWAALAAGAVVLLGAVLLPRFIDVNTYRPLIQSKAEQALGRPVRLGGMSLSVFPSIAIRVENPEVPGLLRARALRVGVRLLPLLRGAVELRQVVLHRPEITLARRADGTWDLGAPAAGEPAPATPPAEPSAPTRFALSRLVVDEGLVHLTLNPPQGEPVRQDLAVDLEGSLEGEGLARLSGSFEGSIHADEMRLQAEGTFQRSENETRADVSLDEASIPLAWARRLAVAAGMAWPVPEGMLQGESLRASGRLAARLAAGEPSRFDLRGVHLEGADVTLARDARGAWNIAALLQAPPAAEPASPPAPAAEITIDDLRVDNARLRLHDESVAPANGRRMELELDDVDLHVRSFAPGRPLDAEMSAGIKGGGSLRVDGKLPPSIGGEADVNARVTLDGIRIGPIAPYLLALGGVGAQSGVVSAKASLSGSWPARVRAEGTLSVQDVVLAGSQHGIDASADFDVAALEQGARTEIAKLRARSGGSQVELSGWIDNRQGATRVDLTIPPADVQVRDLMDIMAVAGVGLPVEFSSGKPVQVEARVRGELSPARKLDLAGRVTVADATLKHASMTQPLRAVNGTVTLRGNGFEVSGFSASIGGSDVAGSLALEGFDTPHATFQLRSKHADFLELLSFLKSEPAPQTGGQAPKPAAPAPAAAPGMFDALTARGILSIDEGSFETLDFSKLSTTLSLEHRVVRLDPVEMTLYGGAVSGSAQMDLRADPPVYSVSTQLRGVDTDALLADNLDMKGALSGALSGRLSVSSTGRSQEEALRNASGGGEVKLERGRVGPINVLGVLSKASDVLGERSLEKISGKLAKEGTDFSVLTASLKTAQGEILTDNLHMTSPDLELKDDGTLNMLKGTIEIAGEIVLSSEISQAMREEKSRAAEYFWDARLDRVNLPLTLSGPVAAPQPSIDWRTAGGNLARRRIEDRLREKLGGKRLEDLLGGRREPPSPGGTEGSGAPAPGAAGPASSTPGSSAPGVQPAGGPAGGAPSIQIDEKKFSGNLLMPDLKIKGTLRGTGLATAAILVKDEKGKVLHEESLEPKIQSFYAAAADRAAPAVIPFRLTVVSRKVMGARQDVVVTVTVQDDQGRTAESTFRVER